MKKRHIPILCIDFDGVLHSYTSGWQGPRKASDPPVDGAIEWLRSLLGCPEDEGIGPRYLDFKVCIYSSRSKQFLGKQTMKTWLNKWGLSWYEIELIKFPTRKPAAFLTIDDRALCFDGIFVPSKTLLTFKPWNKEK